MPSLFLLPFPPEIGNGFPATFCPAFSSARVRQGRRHQPSETDYGVTAILNLQTDHDFDYWDLEWSRIEARCRELEIEVRRIPVRDFDGEDLRNKLPQCVQALDELLRAGHTVYTHCNVGPGGRPAWPSPTCVWKQGWNVDDAIEHVTKCRSCSPNIDAIVSAGANGRRRKSLLLTIA